MWYVFEMSDTGVMCVCESLSIFLLNSFFEILVVFGLFSAF